MYGWVILYALIIFIAFISGLVTIASFVTGIVNRNRSLIDLGLKALIVTVVTIGIYYMLSWMFTKSIALHVKTILDSIK